jgi:uncharacterized protein YutD
MTTRGEVYDLLDNYKQVYKNMLRDEAYTELVDEFDDIFSDLEQGMPFEMVNSRIVTAIVRVTQQ